jgi:hypothetical protein
MLLGVWVAVHMIPLSMIFCSSWYHSFCCPCPPMMALSAVTWECLDRFSCNLVWTLCHSKLLLFNSSYCGNIIICCRSAPMAVVKTRYMCGQWEVGLDWNRLETSLAIRRECCIWPCLLMEKPLQLGLQMRPFEFGVCSADLVDRRCVA